MAKPILLDVRPHVTDYYRKSAATLFDETGGNTGNLAFMYAVASHVGVPAAMCHFGQSAQTIRQAGDVIVLALANQLGSHTDLASAAGKLEEFGLPILGLGLGAQAREVGDHVRLQPGTEYWLHVLATHSNRAPNIGVRGAYTQGIIDSLGYPGVSVVTGCPSNFINTSLDLGERVAERAKRRPIRSIAVNAGIPYIPSLKSLEQNLADIVTLTSGAYIVQHGLEMVQLARHEFDAMDPATVELCRDYIAPQQTSEQFKNWCRRYAFAFLDIRAWMDFVRRFDFVVGTRFHGAMLAIQAGVPAGCIAHDSRTLEMCQTMHIPCVAAGDINGALTVHNILDYFHFDPEAYDATRAILARQYASLWAAAGIPVIAGLNTLARLKDAVLNAA